MDDSIKPDKLKEGDLLSIISPSAGLGNIFPHRVKNGVHALENMGFRVRFEKNALGKSGWVSGTVAERVDDIHRAFSDPEVKGIICSLGGDHSNQLLKKLDFDLIRENPKVFVGYSDISVLHYAIYTQSNLRTFYGPCLLSEFGEYPDVFEYTKKSFFDTLVKGLFGEIVPSKQWTDEFLDWADESNQKKTRKLYPSLGYEWWKEGVGRGKLIGGCVPSINHTLGTEYWIDPTNSLFFLDIPEGGPGQPTDPAVLDSFFADLDNVGLFRSINGLVIGRPYMFSEKLISSLKEIILKYTKPYNYPILFNANIGHCSPILTLPFGVAAEIDSSKDMFKITEPWF